MILYSRAFQNKQLGNIILLLNLTELSHDTPVDILTSSCDVIADSSNNKLKLPLDVMNPLKLHWN